MTCDEWRRRCSTIYANARYLADSYGYTGAGRLAGVNAATIRRAIRRPENTTRPVIAAIRRAAEAAREAQRQDEARQAAFQAREVEAVRAREAQREAVVAGIATGNVVSLATARSARVARRRTSPAWWSPPDAA